MDPTYVLSVFRCTIKKLFLEGDDIMDHLFAPWRMSYIGDENKQQGCIFCDFPKENNDETRNILFRGKFCFVIVNAFPYNSGHLMVAPYRHVANYDELSDEEMTDLNSLTCRCLKMMRKVLKPQGFNLGINMGKVAGAGFDGHVHLHIVPRWNGDTNFMSVINDIRVVPEALEQTYQKFLEAWE